MHFGADNEKDYVRLIDELREMLTKVKLELNKQKPNWPAMVERIKTTKQAIANLSIWAMNKLDWWLWAKCE